MGILYRNEYEFQNIFCKFAKKAKQIARQIACPLPVGLKTTNKIATLLAFKLRLHRLYIFLNQNIGLLERDKHAEKNSKGQEAWILPFWARNCLWMSVAYFFFD